MSGHIEAVESVAWAASASVATYCASWLASGALDGAARVWDADSGLCLRTLKCSDEAIVRVRFGAVDSTGDVVARFYHLCFFSNLILSIFLNRHCCAAARDCVNRSHGARMGRSCSTRCRNINNNNNDDDDDERRNCCASCSRDDDSNDNDDGSDIDEQCDRRCVACGRLASSVARSLGANTRLHSVKVRALCRRRLVVFVVLLKFTSCVKNDKYDGLFPTRNKHIVVAAGDDNACLVFDLKTVKL